MDVVHNSNFALGGLIYCQFDTVHKSVMCPRTCGRLYELQFLSKGDNLLSEGLERVYLINIGHVENGMCETHAG